MYKIYIERTAERDLKNLSAKIFRKVVSGIRALNKNPRPTNSKKIVTSKNDWRIRIGNYRIIYEINEKDKVIRIMWVRHRKDVYRMF